MVTQNTQHIIEEKDTTTTRPPIVVVLGHVDHGKSSLLQAVKEDFQITSRESGGITQHIGAYEVEHEGRKITFIDTPGHEAFSAMRSRGAKVADIAILVVAAEEGVKPQTEEAIKQAKIAGIPMVVAINKIDKPEANAQKVKQELAKYDIIVESFGGQVPAVETSAITKQGIKELLDMVLLVAEMENLQVHLEKPGKGVIIETYLDSKRGPTATLLLRDGKVQVGDSIATKSQTAKVLILENFQGEMMKQALPSQPAAVIGFEVCPQVGEEFRVLAKGESMAPLPLEGEKTKKTTRVIAVEPGMHVLNIILKADVAGSLEALEHVLLSLPQEPVIARIVKAEVGEIGEDDVKFARSTKALILGFRTKVASEAADLAERDNVVIENFDIIYELAQRVRELMERSVEEQGGREDLGALRVLAVFLIDKNRQIIGGRVAEGEVRKGSKAEVVRNEEIIGTGKVVNVQRDKKDVVSLPKGAECGLHYEGSEKIQEGDMLRFYIEKAPRK